MTATLQAWLDARGHTSVSCTLCAEEATHLTSFGAPRCETHEDELSATTELLVAVLALKETLEESREAEQKMLASAIASQLALQGTIARLHTEIQQLGRKLGVN